MRKLTLPGRKPVVLSLVAMTLLATGATLITSWASSPPDASLSSAGEIADFLTSSKFANCDARGREQYLRQLSDRYLHCDPQGRQELDAALQARSGDWSRYVKRQMGLAMVHQMLASYRETPEPQRKTALVQLKRFSDVMGLHGGAAAALDPSANPVAEASSSPEQFDQWLGAFQRDVLQGFSAQERATMALMAGDYREITGRSRGQK